MFRSLTRKFCAGIFYTTLCCSLLLSCRPKELYETVESPMKDFMAAKNDTLTGASSVTELSCFLFSALTGEVSLDRFMMFVPDSALYAQIYIQLHEPVPSGQTLKASADSVRSNVRKGYLQVLGKAPVFDTSWEDSEFERLLIIDMDGQRLPSKKIIIEARAGEKILRASAKCMQIGDRWYIGEGLRFGV